MKLMLLEIALALLVFAVLTSPITFTWLYEVSLDWITDELGPNYQAQVAITCFFMGIALFCLTIFVGFVVADRRKTKP